MTGEEIAAIAAGWLGTPYRHQASCKGQGTDCLGLLRGIWREVVGAEPVRVPPYTPQWHHGEGEPLLEAAARFLDPVSQRRPAPGDVLVFRMRDGGPARHCGIYAGDDLFIHAYDRRVVTLTRYSPWWRRRLAGQFRFPGTEGPVS